MSGKLQYQFKGSLETRTKEKNYVVRFAGLWNLISAVIKSTRKRPDGIYIFFDKNRKS